MSDILSHPPDPSPASGWTPMTVMIGEVADLIGGSGDPDSEAKAIRFLDRAADEMNLSGVYMFMRKEKTYDSLTAGQSTLERPTDFGWPDDGFRAYNSSNKKLNEVEWLDWTDFQRNIGDTTTTNTDNQGSPEYASLRSENDDISIWPYISTDKVSSIVMPYYARVERPSETTEMLITPEARECLIKGGEAFFMRLRYAKFPQVWRPFWKDFMFSISKARGAAWRYRQTVHSGARPDERGRLPTGSNVVNAGGEVKFLI